MNGPGIQSPRVSIENLRSDAYVKVVGQVEHLPALVMQAPFSGRTCVYCEYDLRVPGALLPATRTSRGVGAFLLRDAGGAALVRMKTDATAEGPASWRATIYLARRDYVEGTLEPGTEEARVLLERHGELQEMEGQLTYREGVLVAGATVAVFGVCLHEMAPTSAFDSAPYRGVDAIHVIGPPENSYIQISTRTAQQGRRG